MVTDQTQTGAAWASRDGLGPCRQFASRWSSPPLSQALCPLRARLAERTGRLTVIHGQRERPPMRPGLGIGAALGPPGGDAG
jgi:hypothetical protein